MILDNFQGQNFIDADNLPGYRKWQGRQLKFRPVGVNIEYILDKWPDCEWIGDAQSFVDDYHKTKKLRDDGAIEKHKVHTDDGTYEFKRTPMAHQETSFVLARNREEWAHLHEQGVGKTKIILDTASYLFTKGEIEMLVVVAWPNGIHRGWVDIECPEDVSVPYHAGYWTSQNTKKKAAELEKVMTYEGGLKIMTFNVEAFASQRAKDFIIRCVKEFKCLTVIDQSAAIKNSQAKRTKFLNSDVRKLSKYRRLLDGAPNAEGPEELYSQFYFLNPMIIGHDTFTAFKAEFCRIKKLEKGEMIVGYKNTEELHRRIDGYCDRVLESECLNLPPRFYRQWLFDLNDTERKLFDDLLQKNVAEFKGDLIEPTLPLVKRLRLQQISCGWFPVDKVNPISEKSSRLRAFESFIKEIGDDPVLIFSRFKADIAAIENLLGDKSCSYHGSISEDDRAEAKRAFQAGEKQYFIGQPRNAGIGHTLTAAKWVVFYNNDPSLRFREECEKRAHRKGQADRLGIIDLIASKTLDARDRRILRQKKDIANLIMRDPENYFLIDEVDEDD
jgi:hypothetical protein